LRRLTGKRRAILTAIGVTLSGKIYNHHFDKSMNSECMTIALEHMGLPVKGEWILI
jgi:hypothetical protein